MALGMSTVTTHCTALFIQTLILIASLPKQKCLVLIFIYVSYRYMVENQPSSSR